MKKIARLLPVALLLTALPCAAQGPLSPPGPPAPTMKTLEQIEPRTPISSLPYTITNSGSYYVVSNLYSFGNNGIRIQTSGVTVDLMGFSLTGDLGTGGFGIYVVGATNAVIDKVVIKNGTVSLFRRGFHCQYMNNSRIEQMVVSGNNDHAVYFGGCNGNTIADCTISGNSNAGVSLSGHLDQCNGNTISDCTISDNGSGGVYLSSGSGQCDGNTIADCNISGNSRGVSLSGYLGQCDGNTISDCTISDNSSGGVSLNGIVAGQCTGNTIADCTISGNGSDGVYFGGGSGQCNGNAVLNCTISKNLDRGVDLVGTNGECDGNTIQGNRIKGNAERGIAIFWGAGNRVEANNIWGTTGTGTTYGIWTTNTTDNFIFKNTCVGQTNNFHLDPADTYGPIVTNSGSLPTSGAAAHPWANFSR